MKSLTMRRPIIFFFIALFVTQANAKNVSNSLKVEEGGLYVVLTGKPNFDSSLKKAVMDYWQVTKNYEFISDKQVKEFDKNKNNLILMVKNKYFNNSGDGRLSSGLFLFRGSTKYMIDAIAVVSFDAYGLEGNVEKAAYRMSFMIKDLNDKILIRGNKIENNGKLLKQKILLVKEDYFHSVKKSHDAVIKKGAFESYAWKYEILSEEKIKKLIEEKDERYALFCTIVTDDGAVMTIYDLATAEIIFRYYNKGTIFRFPWVKEKQIERLNKEITESK